LVLEPSPSVFPGFGVFLGSSFTAAVLVAVDFAGAFLVVARAGFAALLSLAAVSGAVVLALFSSAIVYNFSIF